MIRYIDTLLWNEDWFCELGAEDQIFWNYITCNCNNAGIWKPNKIDFEVKSRSKINMVAFLDKVNEGGCKERIFTTETRKWFLTGFIMFQWFNKKNSFDLILTNKLHLHIYDLLIKEKIPFEKIRGLEEVLKTPKEKFIINTIIGNKDNSTNKDNNGGLEEVLSGPKLNDIERVFLQQGGTKEMALYFFNQNEATGWKLKQSAIKNFAPLIGNFIANWNKNQKNGNQFNAKDARSAQLNDIYAEVNAAIRKSI